MRRKMDFVDYEVLTSGPVVIRHVVPIQTTSKEFFSGKKFAFQVFCGWKPMLMSTAKCFTKVVCQSEIPVFAQPAVQQIVAQGTNIEIHVGPKTKIINKQQAQVTDDRKGTSEPLKEFVVVCSADMRRFGEQVELVVTSDAVVFCDASVRRVVVCGAESSVRIVR